MQKIPPNRNCTPYHRDEKTAPDPNKILDDLKNKFPDADKLRKMLLDDCGCKLPKTTQPNKNEIEKYLDCLDKCKKPKQPTKAKEPVA